MLDLGGLDVDVQLLKKLVSEHGPQIEILSSLSTYLVQAHFAVRASHAELLDRHLALCDCICKTGLISREDLLQHLRATRSSRCFRNFLEEPRPAHLLLQHLGLWGSESLLAASCEAARLLAEATAQCTGTPRAEGGGRAPAEHDTVRQGVDLPISLPSLWRVGSLAERLSCTLSAWDVRRLRSTCSSSRERLRIVYCRIAPVQFGGIGAKLPREGLRRADLGANESLHFCNFLQEIWQYSTLADALIYSMDASGIKQFRVLSRGCCECIRSHRSCKQRFDPRRTRVPVLAPEAVHLQKAPVKLGRQSSPEHVVGLPAGQQEGREGGTPSEADPAGSGASNEAAGPCLALALAEEDDGEQEPSVGAPRSEAGGPPLPPALAEEDDGEQDPSVGAPRTQPAEAQAPAEGASPGGAPKPGQRRLPRGKPVRVIGLQRLKHFNGKSGRLVPRDAEPRHWHVVLNSGEYLRVRPDNVEFLSRRHRDDGRTEGATAAERRAIMLHLLCSVRGLLGHTAGFAGPLAVSALATASESLFRRISGQGKLYVLGGVGGDDAPLSSVESFDLVSGAWQRRPEMTCPREGHAAAMVAGRIYVCGGSDGDSWLASMERLDVRGGSWEPMPPMSTPRLNPAMGAIGGYLYIVGGQYCVPLRSAERFDPVKKVWHALDPLRTARAMPTVAVAASQLYVIGGADLGIVNSAERFNPRTGTWQVLPHMAEARYLPATTAAHGSLFVCGGYNGAGMQNSERFDIAAGEWIQLPPMVQARWGASAVAVRRRQGLVVWGGSVEQGPLAEALDLQAGAWEALENSVVPRTSAGSCLMAAGRLYILGGADADGAISAVERVDIVSEKWEKVSSMSGPRNKASSFLTLF